MGIYKNMLRVSERACHNDRYTCTLYSYLFIGLSDKIFFPKRKQLLFILGKNKQGTSNIIAVDGNILKIFDHIIAFGTTLHIKLFVFITSNINIILVNIFYILGDTSKYRRDIVSRISAGGCV